MKIKGGFFSQLLLFLGLLVGTATAVQAQAEAAAPQPEQFEILIADSSAQALESLFGEASLLVLPKGGRWDEGVVVNFAVNADSSKGTLDHYYKAFTGGFPFRMGIIPSHAFFNQTLVYEKRDVRRLILPLTAEQKKNLWQQILYFQAHPKSLGDFYFHFRNSVGMLYLLLKKAGIQVNYNQLVVRSFVSLPGDQAVNLPEISRSVLLSPFPQEIVPSIASLVEVIEKKYDISLGSDFDKDRNQFAAWSESEFQTLSKMSTEELVIAAQALALRDSERTPVLQRLIRARHKRVSVQFVRYQNYPESFYNICESGDSSCDTRLIQDMASTYSLEKLKSIYSRNRFAEIQAMELFQPEFDIRTSEQAQHWRRLMAALRAYLKTKR